MDAVVARASERRGKPGVVFAHSLAAVENLRKRLAAEGFRVGTISGKDSAKEKAKRIDGFNPQSGEADTDILVCSDAGATGANLQSGKWLINFDTPETAKTHAQRNGRINRIGQTSDVELMDIVRDHPAEARNRARLKRKYALRELTTTPMESLDDTGVAYFLRRRQVAQENGGVT
jgi:superfamily II DNA/RNA helicase